MRVTSHLPSRQLGSVAARYQHTLSPTAARRAASGRGPWWAGLGSEHSPTDQAEDDAAKDVRSQRLEAVLFLAREPLSSRKLSFYANLADGTEARTLIRRLNQKYDEAGRAFRIEEFAGGFQMLSRPQFAGWLRRLAHVPGETRLSAPAMETLAVVAYRQPVLRADIEAIRGVNCGEILRQLMERDLVRIGGRSDELGRPYLYSTSRRFLQLMGLPGVDQLPRADVLRNDHPPATVADSGNSNFSPSNSDSRDERQPENVDMKVTATEPLQFGPKLDEVALLATALPLLQADEEEDLEDDFDDDDDDYEDDDDELDDDELEDDELEDEDLDDELEDEIEEEIEEEEELEDEELEDEELEDEELEDEEPEDEEEEESDEEEWEEVDDEDDDEEWEDDDMDWEDEFDEMD